ncbi:MAG: tail fiber domain-containing protein [Paludibacter sp.]|nr:tail fiber domain-containing protein [Paludibacter sp.]
MKTIKIIFSILSLVTFTYLNAQLKVLPSGKTYLGTLPNATQDPDNVIKFHVFGEGPCGSLGPIAIGDYGRASTGSCNVVVGEYGNDDTDKLWLHGNYGIYLTYNNGNSIIGSYDVNDGNKFNFNCEVWSTGIKLTSDERLKTNVNKISNSITNLQKLTGVSYNLLDKQTLVGNKKLTKSANESNTTALTEKEQKNKDFFETYNANILTAKPKRMGFLAQDLQKVFPELVDKDSLGYYSVDYIGLIPVIIEAFKEQQNTINLLNQRLAVLESTSISKMSLNKSITPIETDALTYSVLDQNVPNPFNTATTIGFYLPNSITTASIYVYDMNGGQLKSITISERGKGNVTIQGSEFSAGMYLYALIIDGKVIDTKRMILTK